MQMVDFALLILRVVVGLLFFGHGAQKLFGWFGGGGLEGTTKFFSNLNVKPTRLWTVLASLSETFGGLGLAFGLLTPLAAAAIIGVMLIAIIKVHWQHGLWNTNRGIEYPLTNSAVALVIGLAGPGIYSLDSALHISYPMPASFLVALAIVILGVLIALASGQALGDPGRAGRLHRG